jgi:hypothetical protein
VTDRDRVHPDAEVVDRLERGLPAQSKEEEETRAVYQRLIGRIGDLDLVAPAPGWEDRAVERWEREVKPRPVAKRRRRRWWPSIAAAAVAIAAALVLLVLRCGDGELRDLEVAVVDDTGRQHRQGGAAAIGQTLEARARVDEPHVELRVYRDQVLIARCPGDARCLREGASLSIRLVLEDPGVYEVIRLSSRDLLPPPHAAGLAVDEVTAREREAHVTSWPTITVR